MKPSGIRFEYKSLIKAETTHEKNTFKRTKASVKELKLKCVSEKKFAIKRYFPSDGMSFQP